MPIYRFSVRGALAVFVALATWTSAGTAARAQAQNADQVPVTRTVGLLDSDGSALYSVLFESAGDPLSNLTITSTLPAGTTFVEEVGAPYGASVVPVPDSNSKSVTWQYPGLDANTILGPFTYRVKAADPSVAFPAGVAAEVSWTAPAVGAVNAAPGDGVLHPLDTSGQLTVDSKGTVDDQGQPLMVPVGHTGFSVYVPPGAVPQSVTLTITRAATVEKTGSSDLDFQFWWCARFNITSTPPVTLAQPIQLSVPTRQALTPYLSSQAFAQDSAGNWHASNDILSLTVLADGSHILSQISGSLAAPAVSLSGGASHSGMMAVANQPRALALEGCNILPGSHANYCDPRAFGVKQASRLKSYVKAPVITQVFASGTGGGTTGAVPKLLDAVYPTCYIASSGATRCTVYKGGVYQGYIEYLGQTAV